MNKPIVSITRNESFAANELNDLLKTNNWQIEPSEKLELCIQSSWGWVTARNDAQSLIGFVQVISDSIFHAYICRMIVHPDYRKKGIGTLIMTELLEMLKESKLLPTLVATQGNTTFYEKFGFRSEYHGLTALCIR